MRRLLFLPLWVLIAGPAAAQGFAPPQSRAAEPAPRPPRVLAGATRPGMPAPAAGSLLNTGVPVPVPLGMVEGALPGSTGVLSARVPTFGAPVTLPPSAALGGTRLYTYTNARGGLESVAYDPGTGATVVYDQTLTYSLQNRRDLGLGGIPRVGASSAAGIINNPSFSLQPGQAVPASGIPLLNQASPSYNYRSNLGTGIAPVVPATPSPFGGTGLGSFGSAPAPGIGGPSSSFGSAPSPSVGVP
ncbi:hypothetical protein [Tautonia plasticadhaerens]|uniref:Uncharacterized protein n=1 Tax=Tautonia plasticadhaerens TaxID=2527974 RepID=A0A518HCK6_9BACT|nr:hypothetical protein [Tautonia plasticadhaerens]QDV38592.1 hypothetical protein ElP_65470 [Tautonia plasticadhaerens]